MSYIDSNRRIVGFSPIDEPTEMKNDMTWQVVRTMQQNTMAVFKSESHSPIGRTTLIRPLTADSYLVNFGGFIETIDFKIIVCEFFSLLNARSVLGKSLGKDGWNSRTGRSIGSRASGGELRDFGSVSKWDWHGGCGAGGCCLWSVQCIRATDNGCGWILWNGIVQPSKDTAILSRKEKVVVSIIKIKCCGGGTSEHIHLS